VEEIDDRSQDRSRTIHRRAALKLEAEDPALFPNDVRSTHVELRPAELLGLRRVAVALDRHEDAIRMRTHRSEPAREGRSPRKHEREGRAGHEAFREVRLGEEDQLTAETMGPHEAPHEDLRGRGGHDLRRQERRPRQGPRRS
jgi:hypothetical protein